MMKFIKIRIIYVLSLILCVLSFVVVLSLESNLVIAENVVDTCDFVATGENASANYGKRTLHDDNCTEVSGIVLTGGNGATFETKEYVDLRGKNWVNDGETYVPAISIIPSPNTNTKELTGNRNRFKSPAYVITFTDDAGVSFNVLTYTHNKVGVELIRFIAMADGQNYGAYYDEDFHIFEDGKVLGLGRENRIDGTVVSPISFVYDNNAIYVVSQYGEKDLLRKFNSLDYTLNGGEQEVSFTGRFKIKIEYYEVLNGEPTSSVITNLGGKDYTNIPQEKTIKAIGNFENSNVLYSENGIDYETLTKDTILNANGYIKFTPCGVTKSGEELDVLKKVAINGTIYTATIINKIDINATYFANTPYKVEDLLDSENNLEINDVEYDMLCNVYIKDSVSVPSKPYYKVFYSDKLDIENSYGKTIKDSEFNSITNEDNSYSVLLGYGRAKDISYKEKFSEENSFINYMENVEICSLNKNMYLEVLNLKVKTEFQLKVTGYDNTSGLRCVIKFNENDLERIKFYKVDLKLSNVITIKEAFNVVGTTDLSKVYANYWCNGDYNCQETKTHLVLKGGLLDDGNLPPFIRVDEKSLDKEWSEIAYGKEDGYKSYATLISNLKQENLNLNYCFQYILGYSYKENGESSTVFGTIMLPMCKKVSDIIKEKFNEYCSKELNLGEEIILGGETYYTSLSNLQAKWLYEKMQ